MSIFMTRTPERLNYKRRLTLGLVGLNPNTDGDAACDAVVVINRAVDSEDADEAIFGWVAISSL